MERWGLGGEDKLERWWGWSDRRGTDEAPALQVGDSRGTQYKVAKGKNISGGKVCK